jgi:hypothetical protein
MPSLAAHISCSKIVYERLGNGINEIEFFMGGILPDLIDNKYHFKEISLLNSNFYVPNINNYLNEDMELSESFKLGYLAHLLLDRYFLERYVLVFMKEKLSEENIFLSGNIYEDYTVINYRLLKYFGVSHEFIERLIDIDKYKAVFDINETKFRHLCGIVRSTITELDPKYINIDEFVDFIGNISVIIADEIKGMIRDEKIFNPQETGDEKLPPRQKIKK